MNNDVKVALLIGFLVFVVMILPKILSKGISKAAKAVNKKFIYRNEYKEEQEFVSEILTFKSAASVSDIKRQIMMHVAPAAAAPIALPETYQVTESDDLVVYAHGSKLLPQLFVAAINFTNKGETTEGAFQFMKWNAEDGMIRNLELMKKLREKIYAAFIAADPASKVIGSPKVSS